MSWRDLVITPAVEVVLVSLSVLGTIPLASRFELSSFSIVVIWYLQLVLWTLVALKVLRVFYPMREGTFSADRDPLAIYVWNLYGFLCITNLSLPYMNAMLPPPFRKFFYQLMGATTGRGLIIIGGRITEPHLVRLGDNSMIGDDALILPHALAKLSDDVLFLGRIEIGANAIVGARSVILPGVTVGQNSMVTMMSLVERNTIIPPNEIWGGVPAKKLKDRPIEGPR